MADLPHPRRLWADGSIVDVAGIAVTRLTPGPAPTVSTSGSGGVVHIIGADDKTTLVRLDVPLGDAAGFWHPGAGWDRHLAADWMTGWRTVGLVDSSPLGCLHDSAGRAMLGFATDRLVPTTRLRYGVGERTGRFGVWLAMDLRPGERCRIRVAAGNEQVMGTVRSLVHWQSCTTSDGLASATHNAAPPTDAPAAPTGGSATPTGDPAPTGGSPARDGGLPGAVGGFSVPEAGRVPAYSTWYSFHQEVSAAAVETEAGLAAELGCGLLILDDGWQRGAHGGGYAGCGDWEPDPEKFPDFGAHVRTVRGLGLAYMAWIAPLLLGDDSAARGRLAAFAPHARPDWRCHVLDPRHEEVRRFVVDSCVRLVERYDLDGLKIDFLDAAMAYADDPLQGEPEAQREPEAQLGRGAQRDREAQPDREDLPDREAEPDQHAQRDRDAQRDQNADPDQGACRDAGQNGLPRHSTPRDCGPERERHPGDDGARADVGEAMRALLSELRDRLRAVRGADLLIELRQPYTGAGMLEFGNLLRAGDCPADAAGNRVRTLDLSVARRESAVHSDMLMWDLQAPPQAAARQLLSVLHAVPQISVRLSRLPEGQRAMTAFWLAFWRERRDVLTRGDLDAGRPDELHPVVVARDAARAVVIVHSPSHAARLDPTGLAEIAVVNDTAAEHVLLDLTHPAAARLDVRDVRGAPVRRESARLEAGPRRLAIPPSGLCLIRPA
uniref:glycoside hydrolase family 36 protein n=1 Tax=Nonomuraea pusilla TaxID=46177 RepID=UPI0006E35FFE|nr:glycoside hydrolase family 36 protein [Nonomuraea pusilla]